MRVITEVKLCSFKAFLIEEEKAEATIEKYIRDNRAFMKWMKGKEMSKSVVLQYKQYLMERYAPSSINSILSSLNSFFEFSQWTDLKVRVIKMQRRVFADENREITKEEYWKLLRIAKEQKPRLYYVMQTICATGLRVSELEYITKEVVDCGEAVIHSKGKMRVIILPQELCSILKEYLMRENIQEGCVFITKGGKPLDRSNIWSEMKKICKKAGVAEVKVFPHNLRHLFARTYYAKEKDVVRLADLLGHTDVNTTRIYTRETKALHREQIENLHLVFEESTT